MNKVHKGHAAAVAAVAFGALAAMMPNTATAGDAQAATVDRGSWLNHWRLPSEFSVSVASVPEIGSYGAIFTKAVLGHLKESLKTSFANNAGIGVMTYPDNPVAGELAALILVPPADQQQMPYLGCIDKGEKILWKGEFNPSNASVQAYSDGSNVPQIDGHSPCEVWAFLRGKEMQADVNQARQRAEAPSKRNELAYR